MVVGSWVSGMASLAPGSCSQVPRGRQVGVIFVEVGQGVAGWLQQLWMPTVTHLTWAEHIFLSDFPFLTAPWPSASASSLSVVEINKCVGGGRDFIIDFMQP